MGERVLVRHQKRKPTKGLERWRAGEYDTYTVLIPITGVRVHEYGKYTPNLPSFNKTLGSLDAIQRSGLGNWYVIEMPISELQTYLRVTATPNPPKVAAQDEWLFQPKTVLNIGVASDYGMPGCGGALQAEYIFGSPDPIPVSSRKVRKNVRQ